MISQALRIMLILGLVMSTATSGTMAPGGTPPLHHQPSPCDPDC
jgi:hypothetical protein